jgi:hypothetical protein
MPGARGAAKAKLKIVNGKLVSAKSKTGNPECSQAMSQFVRGRKTGLAGAALSAIQTILAKCRAQAKQNRGAELKQASGKLAEGRGTWQRTEQARALQQQRAQRAAPAAPAPAAAPVAKPAPKLAPGRGTEDRAAAVRGILAARQQGQGKLASMIRDQSREMRGLPPKPAKTTTPAPKAKAKEAPAPKAKAKAKAEPTTAAARLKTALERPTPKTKTKEAPTPTAPKAPAVPAAPAPASHAASLRNALEKAYQGRESIDDRGYSPAQLVRGGMTKPEAEAALSALSKQGIVEIEHAGADKEAMIRQHSRPENLFIDPGNGKIIDNFRIQRMKQFHEAAGGASPRPFGVEAGPKPAQPKPGREDRLRVLMNRAGGRARDLDARGKLGQADAMRGRKARLQAALDTATGKNAPGFGLKAANPGNGFANGGKGKTSAMFDEMKGAAARDLPGQTTFTDGDKPKPSERADHKVKTGAAKDLSDVLATNRAQRRKKAARLQAVREKLHQAKVDPATHTDHAPGHVGALKTDLIHFDPKRFQYKLAHAEGTGSVGSLAGVKRYDPELGGVLQVWKDPANGKTFVINGHNRLDLARKLGAEKVTVRYIDARDAGEARAKGALTNIAEGRGTSLDAAKFFRDEHVTREGLDARGVPLRDKVASEGLALSHLHDPIFRRVIDGDLSPARGAIIGGSGLDHTQQAALVDLLDKQPKSRSVSDATLKELTDTVRSAGTKTTHTHSLFGDDAEQTSLALHKARAQAHIKGRLATEKKLFGTVAKSKHAAELERAGNRIDTEKSGHISQEADKALQVFDIFKNRSGPVARHLNHAAERLHGGEAERTVLDDTYKKILAEMPGLLNGGH